MEYLNTFIQAVAGIKQAEKIISDATTSMWAHWGQGFSLFG